MKSHQRGMSRQQRLLKLTGCGTTHESYGAYPAATAPAVEYCLVTVVIRATKQKAALASLSSSSSSPYPDGRIVFCSIGQEPGAAGRSLLMPVFFSWQVRRAPSSGVPAAEVEFPALGFADCMWVATFDTIRYQSIMLLFMIPFMLLLKYPIELVPPSLRWSSNASPFGALPALRCLSWQRCQL